MPKEKRSPIKAFKPAIWETYFFVNTGGEVELEQHQGTSTDRKRIESGNCFSTEDMAEAASKEHRRLYKSFK